MGHASANRGPRSSRHRVRDGPPGQTQAVVVRGGHDRSGADDPPGDDAILLLSDRRGKEERSHRHRGRRPTNGRNNIEVGLTCAAVVRRRPSMSRGGCDRSISAGLGSDDGDRQGMEERGQRRQGRCPTGDGGNLERGPRT
jgi:hypothetical protein